MTGGFAALSNACGFAALSNACGFAAFSVVGWLRFARCPKKREARDCKQREIQCGRCHTRHRKPTTDNAREARS
jgi:hypothetical protein